MLAGSDPIDMHGINFGSIHSNFDSSGGTLAINHGSSAGLLRFLGQYSADSSHFADDSNSGTLVIAAMPTNQTAGGSEVYNLTPHDTFVVAPNFGQLSFANFAPATDTLQFSRQYLRT